MNKTEFKQSFSQRLAEKFAMGVADASPNELYQTLGSLMTSTYSQDWQQTWTDYREAEQKQVYYFSIEFLPGKLLKSNLLNMGWLDMVTEGLAELGINLDDLAEVEPDMALGNGGLGRLASCFMDSIASMGLPGNGNGIRYEYGLFKQHFVDNYQVELPDKWLQKGNLWEIRKESKAVDVRLGGKVFMSDNDSGNLIPNYQGGVVLRAVPYDTGMVGYQNAIVNTMRLWSVEIPPEEEENYRSIEDRRTVEDLTSVLYPDDTSEDGRKLRLSQEYFFVSAGVQSILRYYKQLNRSIDTINRFIAIHINDTHPAMCVAEFMRLLVDDEQLSWERAWNLTKEVMSYTNHTIMAEALEKWPISMMESVCPRIYQIIEEIDRRFVEEMTGVHDFDLIQRTRIIQDGQVHMAHLAIIGSHSTNGVAKLHSDLLKSVVLHDFYLLYPTRFNNKTNGIAMRRWSQLANPALSNVLDKTIGHLWREQPNDLRLLLNYVEDDRVLAALAEAKLENKKHLSTYIHEHCGIKVNPQAIFDVQIKRLHAYKRQLLNLLHIMKLYLDLKENPDLPMEPRVFIFGAKAAPSYHYAKSIIKVINEAANLINHDPMIKDKLKVIFLENYNVSLAERIIPAADVSEQISLASKEASGTSNMKLMLNGAVTIATLDGANIEIRDAVGEENIAIFGLTETEVYQYYENKNYSSLSIYQDSPIVQRVVKTLIDGTIPNIVAEGYEIFDSLIKYNDEFFVLRDFEDYCLAQESVNKAYQNKRHWSQISLRNIAHAGRFSSDDTVQRYAEDIWQIEPVFAHKNDRGVEHDSYLL
ncbi:glycogen/starch/alpha-glucan phosphorylase [Enterococcus dongliensis]|uniref:Alpha-1,4 glucan phosphorylase n=1 Tax=Enterococcus dongliensis TaxID=2559925 RepID=A0AAW8TJA9_9ENTE|nr:glycogen/starch/alpha-glucan phosphorylase [Enterococcus dongliensis]MDT2604274.1 glycogen/starch/alpha-glucan phosphorylase [Enterococcus dongliensis]MDT2634992.1 glycogen/starch/alpha-glucan phosphorylase [Enterococcus dongliensis]MDT2636200.1 glycogen/starch/alpha-glucan phosphorylase [Enterococcus dongliensis]MDT2643011.1 glycogen/starch/alpha-glucan phosphorylase [Enterococcus dongliensis]MDT2645532.1 glycogen/starch/alpha-glucan phosphorylase [Enterococcus dongliensis]